MLRRRADQATNQGTTDRTDRSSETAAGYLRAQNAAGCATYQRARGASSADANLAHADNHTWVLLAVMIGLGAGGHFLMNWAHAFTPLMLTSLLTLASPVISVAAAAAFLGEPVLMAQVIGMAIVLSSLGTVLARTAAASGSEVEDIAKTADSVSTNFGIAGKLPKSLAEDG